MTAAARANPIAAPGNAIVPPIGVLLTVPGSSAELSLTLCLIGQRYRSAAGDEAVK